MFLTSVLDGDAGQLQFLAALLPGNNSDTQWSESWVDPRAGLDILGKRESSCLCRDSNP